MSMKTLLAAMAALGLAGFLLTPPAYSNTSATFDPGARPHAQQSGIILAEADKKKAKKKTDKKKKPAKKKTDKKKADKKKADKKKADKKKGSKSDDGMGK
jgi:hypothetical protein